MQLADSIFLDVHLPNATTWFYFSGLLAVALFFKFSRLLSIRNWDVLTLFLLLPGLLLLIEAHARERLTFAAAAGPAGALLVLIESQVRDRWAFVWLLSASGYFFVRCLLDLVLVRRPALSPNLNLAGLAWLAGALFVSLIAVAVRQPAPNGVSASPASTLDNKIRNPVKVLVGQPTAENDSLVNQWVECGLALGCHLAIAVGLVLIGFLHFEDVHSGMAMATFYLLLPYVFLMMPGAGLGRWEQAWPMAWMVWAVVTYRRPLLTGLLLGLASGTIFLPALTLPVWLSFYRGRGAGRFLTAYLVAVALCLVILGGLNIVGELPHSLQSMWSLSGWQTWKTLPKETVGFWGGDVGLRAPIYRLPIFIASMAFVVFTLFWPTPKNLAHVLALSAATLISVQFWYADQGGIHVLWYLPYLLLLVFRPNLSAAQPAVPPDDWLARTGRMLRRWFTGLLRWLGRLRQRPQPAAPVS